MSANTARPLDEVVVFSLRNPYRRLNATMMKRPNTMPYARQRQVSTIRPTICLLLAVAALAFYACAYQLHAAGTARKAPTLPGPLLPAARDENHLVKPEIWAKLPRALADQELVEALGNDTGVLEAQCGRSLYRTLTHYTKVHQLGYMTVVLTGDIPAMWIRDSAVQLAIYLPRIKKRPALRCAAG